MKTSNIILISFLIFLFGGITLLYIGSKYYNAINDPSNINRQEKKLPSFSVVVAESGAIFELYNAKENKIIQPYRKDSIAHFPPYFVKNDTLFVSAVKQIHLNNYRITTVVSCVDVKNILIKENSNINMNNFKADTLNINMSKSKLDLRFHAIFSISLQAKDSDIYLEGKKLKGLSVNLDKTKLNASITKRVDQLTGNLKNNSDCTFSISDKIQLDSDQTSIYDFYNYSN